MRASTPVRRVWLVLLCLLVAVAPARAEYKRWEGLQSKEAAAADARRLAGALEEWLKAHPDADCPSFSGKYGTYDITKFVNEEGLGFQPPRSGFEVPFYNRIKDFIEAHPGQQLDTDALFRMGLETCAGSKGDVSLQDVAITIHNVMRLLSRTESWSVPKHYPGFLMPTPWGVKPVTSGTFMPAWRGMTTDPVYPILQDLGGTRPTQPGKKTMFELFGGGGKVNMESVRQKHQQELARIDAEIARIDRQIAALQYKLPENTWTPDASKPRDWADRQREAQEKQRQIDELNASKAKLLIDRQDPFIHRWPAASTLFNPKTGAFKPPTGAQEQEGVGGGHYYFWLGAAVRTMSIAGHPIQKGGWWWERGQKWLGSEQEYARGLIQLSHYDAGGTMAGVIQGAILRCMLTKKKKGPEPGFVTVQKTQADWYCTNRPTIETPVTVPDVVVRGNRSFYK